MFSSSCSVRPVGSPPRMRGEAAVRLLFVPWDGITPAHAGRSFRPIRGVEKIRDHPRVCGEKPLGPLWPYLDTGSPPRMRGEVAAAHGRPRAAGITPAYAGRSISDSHCGRQLADHPRVCGEKGSSCRTHLAMAGSPPRMRGEVLAAHPLLLNLGITPAYAGRSQSGGPLVWVARDHPRVCGEKHC